MSKVTGVDSFLSTLLYIAAIAGGALLAICLAQLTPTPLWLACALGAVPTIALTGLLVLGSGIRF
jgi:hypothetical protein